MSAIPPIPPMPGAPPPSGPLPPAPPIFVPDLPEEDWGGLPGDILVRRIENGWLVEGPGEEQFFAKTRAEAVQRVELCTRRIEEGEVADWSTERLDAEVKALLGKTDRSPDDSAELFRLVAILHARRATPPTGGPNAAR